MIVYHRSGRGPTRHHTDATVRARAGRCKAKAKAKATAKAVEEGVAGIIDVGLRALLAGVVNIWIRMFERLF